MLRAYLDAAMRRAQIEELPVDEGYFGEIPGLDGLWANAPTHATCETELASALEAWVMVSLRLGHDLPEIEGISLALPEIA